MEYKPVYSVYTCRDCKKKKRDHLYVNPKAKVRCKECHDKKFPLRREEQ